MKKKICIIGTHSAGKTSLSYMLAVKYKILDKSIKIVQEVARSCPYPINEGMNKDACLWIYYEHVKKELDAMQKHDVVICDRSAIDSFMYAKAQNCFDETDSIMIHSFAAAEEWMDTYDEIIYVKPGDMKPTEDGVRSTDMDFRDRVEQEFQKWVTKSVRTNQLSIIYSLDIFDNIKTWCGIKQ